MPHFSLKQLLAAAPTALLLVVLFSLSAFAAPGRPVDQRSTASSSQVAVIPQGPCGDGACGSLVFPTGTGIYSTAIHLSTSSPSCAATSKGYSCQVILSEVSAYGYSATWHVVKYSNNINPTVSPSKGTLKPQQTVIIRISSLGATQAGFITFNAPRTADIISATLYWNE